MATLKQLADANLFNVVHAVIARQQAAATAERRGQPRTPFPCTQWIAPDQDREVPSPESLVEIRCHDLTQKGFSFFWPGPPRFRRFIVVFGQPPAQLYVRALVMHWQLVLVDPSGAIAWQGRPGQKAALERPNLPGTELQVLVGCRLTNRL